MNKLISKIVNMSVKEKIVMSLWILVAIFLIAEVAVLVAFQSALTDDNKLSGVVYGWPKKQGYDYKNIYKVIKHTSPEDLKAGFKFTGKHGNEVMLTLVVDPKTKENVLSVASITNPKSYNLGKWIAPVVNNSAKVANDVISSISFIFGTLLLGTVGTTVIIAYHNKHDRFFWQKAKGGAA